MEKKLENGLVMINFLQVHNDKNFYIKRKGNITDLKKYEFNWTSLEEWYFECGDINLNSNDVEEIIERKGKLILRLNGRNGIIKIWTNY